MTELREYMCPACKINNNEYSFPVVSDIAARQHAEDGDVSICFSCGMPAVLEKGQLRELTDDEMMAIHVNAPFRIAVHRAVERHHKANNPEDFLKGLDITP